MTKSRNIFEEVNTEQKQNSTPKGGVIDAGKQDARNAVRIWLLFLFLLVAAMILVGGLTRLTDSGLSITEWAPIKGAIPPLSAADWQVEFEKYQAIPEFTLVNSNMDLAAFKTIYWWEWGHRQLGRFVGLVWAVGLLYFVLRKQVPTGWMPRLILVGLLGGLQGAIGWWMVSSGLTGRMVDVASYRLATHLGLAFIILSILAWYIWLLAKPEMVLFQSRRDKDVDQFSRARILYVLVFFQILMGALVAGIDAGRGYTDWPMMNGAFLPSESFDYEPFWTNFFENPALVQFNHRILAYVLMAFAFFCWWKSRVAANIAVKKAIKWAGIGIVLQMLIGIVTVIYAAPWNLAIFHQFGAIIVILLVLRACFTSLYPPAQSLR